MNQFMTKAQLIFTLCNTQVLMKHDTKYSKFENSLKSKQGCQILIVFPAVQMQGQQTTQDHHCPRLQRGRLSQMPRRRWHLQRWHSRRLELCHETLHREGRVGMRLSGRILVQVRDKIIIKLANWEGSIEWASCPVYISPNQPNGRKEAWAPIQ